MVEQRHINDWFWYWMTPLILAVITIATYIPSLTYEFQFDDEPNILKFYDIRFLTFNDVFFSSSRWISKWVSAWSYHFGRFEPFVYRCANVGFHALTGLIVYYFFLFCLSKIDRDSFFYKNARILSALTAGVFLLHPVQTQTVSYIVQGQMEGLAGLMVMATLLSFVLFAQARNTAWQAIMLICAYGFAFLACGTKEIAIVTPFLVLLTDWFFIAQGNFNSLKRRWLIHVGFFSLVLGIYVWFLGKNYFIQAFGLQLQTDNIPGNCLTEQVGQKIVPYDYCISQFKVILHYLFIFVWPFSICMEYDMHIERSFDGLNVIVPFLTLIFIVGLIGYLLRGSKKNLVAFGLLWFFISIAPRSTIIPSWELVVDYKTYIASIGWIFIIVSFLLWVYQTQAQAVAALRQRGVQILAICFLGACLVSLTVTRNYVWKDSYDFWYDIVTKAPSKARSHNNFGCQLLKRDKYMEALAYFKRAIRMEPGYYDPYNNLAYAYGALNKIDQAIWALREGIRIYPYQPKVYNNLATYLIMKGDYEIAVKAAEQAIELYPYYGKAYFNKGRALMQLDQLEEARECFKKSCLEADFDNVIQGYAMYGDLSLKLNKPDDAIVAFNKVLEMQPDPKALFFLGNAYYQKEDYKNATAHYERSLAMAPENTNIAHNLCQVYLEDNQPIKALEYVRQMEQNADLYPDLDLQKAYAQHLLGNNKQAIMILEAFTKRSQPADLLIQAMNMLQKIRGN